MRYTDAIDAVQNGMSRKEASAKFGVHYQTLWGAMKRAGVSVPPAYQFRRQHSDGEIVALYLDVRSSNRAGEQLGISGERVAQIVRRYERKTGTQLPRFKHLPWKPREDIYCPRCGAHVGQFTENRAKLRTGYCTRCSPLVCHSYKYSDELIERWIEQIKNGSNWCRIGRALGIPDNAQHQIAAATYRRLARDERYDDIAALWPRGVPAYLTKSRAQNTHKPF